ncbi:MAG: dihydrofolate reductase family protein [Planctomycetota bacterium]|nr:dihydrofolate reductase family protein [Planctomycetota bacterium]
MDTSSTPTRQVRYSVAMSLDGYIAGPNGEADWIVMDPDVDIASIYARFDTLLIGRKTYDAMKAMGGGTGEDTMMPGVTSVVFSRTMKPADHPKLTIVSDAEPYVRDLKTKPGKDIWLWGGGELFNSLLEAGLVDGLDVGVIPVLLGGGIPLLPSPSSIAKLVLRKHRVFEKTGTVLLEYDVAR